MAKREKSKKYSGVYYRLDESGKEKTYYILYRQGGRESKLIEEPVGKTSTGMTEAKASHIRAARMRKKELTNTAQRRKAEAERKADTSRWPLSRVWELYSEVNADKPIMAADRSYFQHLASLVDLEPHQLTTNHIDTLRRKLTKTPSSRMKNGEPTMLSPQTIKHVLALLRRLIKFTATRDLCPQPENLRFEMPTVDNEKTEVLSDEQLGRLVAALDAEEDQDAAALIRLALVTGMRKGALLGLRWNDCDFQHGVIILRGEEAKSGKTAAIPMTAAARAVLTNIHRQDSPYIFPGKNGAKRTDYRRIARRVKKVAGLPEDFRPLHGLRHNYASRLASTGEVSLYVLQKLLTHSSPEQTQRYAHLADAALMEAASKLDGMLNTLEREEK